ncbi:hypothetical protein [Desulfosarcina cetonica]|uniref:hypothetical protein n=1 Tax=Desulfosarcina cetonica TaxID=90730 RepID=UPI0006D0399D|nr:hypothetical protein [Desulfosarcina cetonica]
MRKETAHSRQLQALYAKDDSRIQGKPGWEKFPLFWFLLFLSYRCTKRCPYCYAFNQVGDDNARDMDDRTFSRLLEWIPAVWQANNIKVNIINFWAASPCCGPTASGASWTPWTHRPTACRAW